MNTFNYYILILALTSFPGVVGFAQNTSSDNSVTTIFERVVTSKKFKVVGLELIPPDGARYSIANSPNFLAALAQIDLLTLSQIVTNETDYECLTGKDFFIIIPKDDPTKHEVPTSKLEVRINNINDAPYMEILDQITKINSTDRPILLGPLHPIGTPKYNSISLKAGQYKCYELLNEMAIQLKVNSWMVTHLGIYKGPNQPDFPIVLNPGSVSFF